MHNFLQVFLFFISFLHNNDRNGRPFKLQRMHSSDVQLCRMLMLQSEINHTLCKNCSVNMIILKK